MAIRVSYLVIKNNVAGDQQFGALIKRSATDLVSCVIHDIEEAESLGWASTFIVLDVQGAFDAVFYNGYYGGYKNQAAPIQLYDGQLPF